MRRRLALWVLPFFVVALTRCTVGPDYRPPKTTSPASWAGLGGATTRDSSITTPQPVELVEWWKSFDDPTLTSLIERAVGSNLDLRQAEARIRQARAASRIASAALWPTIDSSASFTRSGSGASSSGASGTGGGSGGSGTSTSGSSGPNRNLFQVGLDAAWELDIFGGIRRNVEASEADIQAAVENRRDVMVTLAGEVGNDYITLRGLQQQIVIARKNLDAQIRTAGITKKRFDAGFVSGLDVANANALVATTESQIPLLESQARQQIYSLSVLLGLEPAALVLELVAEKPIPLTPPEVPVGLPSDLLRRRPDIRSAEAQIHSATARIGVATADLFPKFSLTGSFSLGSATLGSLWNWSNSFWSMGPTVRWPVFDAGRIRANIAVQDALQEQSLITYEQTVLTALKDVETALVAYAKEQERRAPLADAVTYNRKAVDLSMQLYIHGKTDFLNVLTAQRDLNSSEDALVQSTRSVATNLVALYKALGGGWEAETEANDRSQPHETNAQ